MSEKIQAVPVTVIIPCYRCRETVVRALNSVLAQTLQPAEILLIDDASADGTLELLRDLERCYTPVVKVIAQEKNGGPGLARNAGWDEATQPWLAFLDADDAWHPVKLEVQWGFLANHPKISLCGHGTQLSVGSVQHTVKEVFKVNSLTLGKMLLSNRLPTRSVMLRRDLPFRFSSKRFSEDYFLWLQIITAGYHACRLEVSLAYSFRPDFSSGGLSGNLWLHEKSELEVLSALWRSGKIGWAHWSLSSAWSFVKFLRRLWLTRKLS